jgi:hypothetical protein
MTARQVPQGIVIVLMPKIGTLGLSSGSLPCATIPPGVRSCHSARRCQREGTGDRAGRTGGSVAAPVAQSDGRRMTGGAVDLS